MTSPHNLLGGPPPTLLPPDPAIAALAEVLERDGDPAEVAARFPASSLAWGALADREYAPGRVVASYAYARTGYHRGLDALRRSGWKGHGPVPWSHQPNQGFLRCLHALGRAAKAIGESDEARRCDDFLRDCDPAAVDALGAPAVG